MEPTQKRQKTLMEGPSRLTLIWLPRLPLPSSITQDKGTLCSLTLGQLPTTMRISLFSKTFHPSQGGPGPEPDTSDSFRKAQLHQPSQCLWVQSHPQPGLLPLAVLVPKGGHVDISSGSEKLR